jgi:hypothetical protein
MTREKDVYNNIARFRPGSTGECEAQLLIFACPPGILAVILASLVARAGGEVWLEHHDYPRC